MKPSHPCDERSERPPAPGSGEGEDPFLDMLSRVVGTGEEAREHRAAKAARAGARRRSVWARDSFERGRQRPPKQPKRRARRDALRRPPS